MNGRRRGQAVWIGFVGALLLGLGFGSPAAGLERVRMGDLPLISNAPIFIAVEKGYFREAGIDLELPPFASAARMIPALSTGELEVAGGSISAGLYNAVADGMDFKIVADKGQTRPGYGYGPILVVRKDLVDSGQVKGPKDLVGRKVSQFAKGVSQDWFLARLLEQHGISPGTVDRVYLAAPSAHKALAGRAIDAALTSEPWGARAEAEGIGVLLLTTDRGIERMQSAVIMYSGRFIRERRPTARAWMQAYLRGIRFYNEQGPKGAEVVAIVEKHTKVPARIIRASVPFYLSNDGRIYLETLTELQEFFLRQGWVKKRVPVEQMVDLSFLE
ncbi:MAG: ABC transporter substrate-binding protein [Deltaproteobacteria bacterium]|nr:ABC transporter substrate-binding protein [Deltaproteobacteria bacterium]